MKALLGLAALALLGACTSGTGIISSTDTQRYIPQSNALFVGNGQLVLIGDSTDAGETIELAQVAADGIARGAFGGKFELTPSELAERPSKNRVVVAIGGANSWQLCEAPPERGGTFNGLSLTISAAACNGTTRLSSTNGSISRLNGADDPALRQFFGQVGAALFPGRNIDYLLRNQDYNY